MKSTSKVLLVIVVILASGACPSLAQVKLVRVKIGDNITMKIPRDFIEMTDRDSRQRVASFRKSMALYTDMNRLAELGVNRSYSRFVPNDYQMMFDTYRASIIALYDEVFFVQENISTIRKQPFVVFEFVGVVGGTETSINKQDRTVRYVYIQYTLFKSDTYVFSFSSLDSEKDQWQETAHQIMQSVSLK